MREIKFRAWDKKTMAMLIWDKVKSIIGNKDCYFKTLDIFNNQNLDIMQFTGLRDKNGKEIYEGDIIRGNKIISEVIWKNDGFGINNGKYNLGWYIDKTHEVIGNIYENPELLEAEK